MVQNSPQSVPRSAPATVPPFDLLMDQQQSWERGDGGQILHRDANGILTNFGLIKSSLADAASRRPELFRDTPAHQALLASIQQGGVSDQDLASVDRNLAYGILKARYMSDYGLDTLPAEIQPQLLDFGLNAGPGRSVQKLEETLAKKGYLSAHGRTHVDDELRDASKRYLADVGMAEFNNALASTRIDFYEGLAQSNPAKAVNLNGWRRRASGFIMDHTPQEYSDAGFKVDAKGHVMLPDSNKPVTVTLANGTKTQLPFDQWYWKNVLQPADNDHASFDARRQRAIRYNSHGHAVGLDTDDREGADVPRMDINDWLPEDRQLYQLFTAFLQFFASLFGLGKNQQQGMQVPPDETPIHNLPPHVRGEQKSTPSLPHRP